MAKRATGEGESFVFKGLRIPPGGVNGMCFFWCNRNQDTLYDTRTVGKHRDTIFVGQDPPASMAIEVADSAQFLGCEPYHYRPILLLDLRRPEFSFLLAILHLAAIPLATILHLAAILDLRSRPCLAILGCHSMLVHQRWCSMSHCFVPKRRT